MRYPAVQRVLSQFKSPAFQIEGINETGDRMLRSLHIGELKNRGTLC
jgi:hypothetical protein